MIGVLYIMYGDVNIFIIHHFYETEAVLMIGYIYFFYLIIYTFDRKDEFTFIQYFISNAG